MKNAAEEGGEEGFTPLAEAKEMQRRESIMNELYNEISSSDEDEDEEEKKSTETSESNNSNG